MYEAESACEQRAHSGGGFSDIFPMPLYQKDAVRRYLKNYPPPYTSEQFNNSGRVKKKMIQTEFLFMLMHLPGPCISRFVCKRVNIILRPCHPSSLLIRSHSANFVIARNGNFFLTFGTSASVQVVGAMLTLINDARLAHGKSTVGES